MPKRPQNKRDGTFEMATTNIFDKLAANEQQLQSHDQSVAQQPAARQPNVFDQLAANNGKLPDSSTPSAVDIAKKQEQQKNDLNMNMSRAMSGQPQTTTEQQQQFDEGKKEGTISGATQIGLGAAGALASAAMAPTTIAKTVGTGLLDAGGNEITKEVLEEGPSKIAQVVKNILPKEATVDQAAKIAKIIYHGGLTTGVATYLYHEIFGR
jgi:hypothetical protein